MGPEHPSVGASLNNLALLYDELGRYADAALLYQRSLVIAEKASGVDHPDVGRTLNNLATHAFVKQDWGNAATFWRRSIGILVTRARRGADDLGQGLTGERKAETEQERYRFWGLLKAAHHLARERGYDQGLASEMFQVAQWGRATEAATSLAQMAARGAKGDGVLADLVRERQDLVGEWQKRDQTRSAAIAQASDKLDSAANEANLTRLANIDGRIADIDKRLKADFAEVGYPLH